MALRLALKHNAFQRKNLRNPGVEDGLEDRAGKRTSSLSSVGLCVVSSGVSMLKLLGAAFPQSRRNRDLGRRDGRHCPVRWPRFRS